MHETPVFARTFDLIVWLLPVTSQFPKSRRHSLTNRVETTALGLLASLIQANTCRGERRRERLQEADGELQCLVYLLRIAAELGDLSGRQHRYVVQKLAEIGRLLGAWLKATDED